MDNIGFILKYKYNVVFILVFKNKNYFISYRNKGQLNNYI